MPVSSETRTTKTWRAKSLMNIWGAMLCQSTSDGQVGDLCYGHFGGSSINFLEWSDQPKMRQLTRCAIGPHARIEAVGDGVNFVLKSVSLDLSTQSLSLPMYSVLTTPRQNDSGKIYGQCWVPSNAQTIGGSVLSNTDADAYEMLVCNGPCHGLS